MMSAPPFPVPRGMEWDPIKRRFFKPAPGTARAAVANGYGVKKRTDKRTERARGVKGEEDVYASQLIDERNAAQSQPVLRSPFRFYPSSASSLQAPVAQSSSWQAVRSTILHSSHASSSQHQVAQDCFRRAKLTRTVYASWSTEEDVLDESRVRTHNVVSNDATGALLFLTSCSGSVYLLDTAQRESNRRGKLSLYKADYDWHARNRPFQSDTPPRTDMADTAVRAVERSNAETKPNRIAFDGHYLAHFASSSNLHLLRLDTSKTNQQKGRSYRVDVVAKIGVAEQHLEAGTCTLAVKDISSAGVRGVILCLGYGGSVTIYKYVHWALKEQQQSALYASFTLSSDVLSMTINPSGTQLLAGCRNGHMYSIEIAGQEQGRRTAASRSKDPRRTCLSFRCAGAITNIHFISDDEFIVATTDGRELYRIALRQPERPQLVYEGHANEWTLNTFLTIDLPHRLFALSGQDDRVRIWSLDHPAPLSSTGKDEQMLGEAVFPDSVCGLTFCQRVEVSRMEGEQNSAFLARGIPALAVSCGNGEIRFFQ